MEIKQDNELAQLQERIDKALEQIKEYGYQDKYASFMQGNHYGFIAVVDAIQIIEKSLRG